MHILVQESSGPIKSLVSKHLCTVNNYSSILPRFVNNMPGKKENERNDPSIDTDTEKNLQLDTSKDPWESY